MVQHSNNDFAHMNHAQVIIMLFEELTFFLLVLQLFDSFALAYDVLGVGLMKF